MVLVLSGELIPWLRYGIKSGDYSLVDGYLETTIKDMMFNGGKGRLESVAELVKRRNKERNDRLSAFNRKKGKGKSEPNILEDFNQENNQGDLKKGECSLYFFTFFPSFSPEVAGRREGRQRQC